MATRISQIGFLGATKAEAALQSDAEDAWAELDGKGSSPAKTPSAASVERALTTAATKPPPPPPPNEVDVFRTQVPFIPIEDLRKFVDAASKNTGVEVAYAPTGATAKRLTFSADVVRAGQSVAFDELMKRAAMEKPSGGTMKTKELAPAKWPTTAARPVPPRASPSFFKKYGLWIGAGAAVVVGVGAFFMFRKKKAAGGVSGLGSLFGHGHGAELPDKVIGWFDVKKKKRKARRSR